MTLIKTNELKPGMRFATQVVIDNRPIAKRGECITDYHIQLFEVWGVGSVEIEGDNINHFEGISLFSNDQLKAIMTPIEEKFIWNDMDDDVLQELKQVILKRTILKNKK